MLQQAPRRVTLQEELHKVKSILDDDNRTQEEVQLVNRLCKKLSFVSIGAFFKRENLQKPNQDWFFNNAWRIVQIATLTGGAKDLAKAKQNAFGADIPSCFPLLTRRNKMYLIKGGFNSDTAKPRSKILFADKYLSVHAVK